MKKFIKYIFWHNSCLHKGGDCQISKRLWHTWSLKELITNLWLYEIFPGYSTRSLQQKRWGTSGQECLELLKKVEKPVSLFIKVRLSRLEPRLTRSRMPPHTSAARY
jgi:hypothetical protein